MSLEQRVEKLERENQRLKMVGGVVATILAVGVLIGAVSPQGPADVIEARAFRVIDGNGEQLAELGSYLLGSRLLLLDNSGRWRAVVTALDDGTRIALYEDDNRIWEAPR